jgi:hypothetical protein
MNNCLVCNKETINSKYCSYICSGKSKVRQYETICQKCNATFYHNNKSYIRLGRLKYCSQECKNRKFDVDNQYFSSDLSDEKLITLGQIIATSEIINHKSFKIFSDIETLNDINDKLKSNYPIEKSSKGKYRITIMDDKIVTDLIRHGLTDEYMKQDVPRDDLWEGLKRTDLYSEEDGLCLFKTEAYKIALWVKNKFDGEIVSKTFKDVAKGALCIEYLVIFKK